MNIIRDIKNKGILYRNLLLNFIVFLAGVIFLLCVIFSFYFTKVATNIISTSNLKVLSQISYSLNYIDDMARRFTYSVYLNDNATSYLFKKDIDLQTVINIEKNIQTLAFPNPYIHSVYLYNSFLDLYISTSTGSYYNSKDFYDKDIMKFTSKAKGNSKSFYSLIPRKAENPPAYGEKSSSKTDLYTYILFDKYTENNGVKGSIILNIDPNGLNSIIDSLQSKNSTDKSETMVIDEKGNVVCHTNENMFLKNISSYSYIKHIITSKSESGYFVDKVNNRKSVITYISSPVMKWKFISITPYSNIFSVINKIIIFSILISGIVLCISLYFAYFASRKIYAPIGSVIEKAQRLEDEKRDKIHDQRNELFRKIIRGNVDINDVEVNTEISNLKVNINFEKDIFLCILKIDKYQEFVSNFNERHRKLLKFAIGNIASEIMKKYYDNTVVDMDEEVLVILCNLEETDLMKDEFNEKLVQIISEIQEYCLKKLNIGLSASIGSHLEREKSLFEVYSKTLNISLYRFIYGRMSILDETVLKNGYNEIYKFPEAKVSILIDSLKLGNFEKSKETYYEVMEVVIKQSYNNILSSLIYFTYTINNKLNAFVDEKGDVFSELFVNLMSNIGNMETKEDCDELFIKLFEDIIFRLGQTNSNKYNVIISSITKYIDEKYSNKEICLNSIAEYFNMSSVYLGKIFRDTTGKSISKYITDKRMMQLKYYLDNTDLSTNEMLDKVGLEKNNYFYTTFKKYFGISLSNYRIEKSGEKINQDMSEDK